MKYEIATQQNAPGKVRGSVAVRKVVLSALIPPTQLSALFSQVECCQNIYFVVVIVVDLWVDVGYQISIMHWWCFQGTGFRRYWAAAHKRLMVFAPLFGTPISS